MRYMLSLISFATGCRHYALYGRITRLRSIVPVCDVVNRESEQLQEHIFHHLASNEEEM